MIEFVLLFALGFLAAALVGLIVAPVIQRRIVILTERRIRASVPLSATEIRAQKDMARAAYAADNARLSVDLKKKGDDLASVSGRATLLTNDLVRIRAEKLAAEQTIEEREADLRNLSAKINARDEQITAMTGSLGAANRLAEARRHEIAERDDRINRMGAEIEEMRIDIATLDTETENFKAQIRELRDERRSLRDTIKQTETEKQDLAFRLKREEARLVETEQKLARAISSLTDRENALERRIAEMERFKQKNAGLTTDLRTARRDLTAAQREIQRAARTESRARNSTAAKPADPKPAAELPRDADEAQPAPTARIATAPPPPQTSQQAAGKTAAMPVEPEHDDAADDGLSDNEKIERLRARHAALNERILKAGKSGNDAALRREIAIVAAMMVELTANRERNGSPIRKILQGTEDARDSATGDPSLAARARDLIAAAN